MKNNEASAAENLRNMSHVKLSDTSKGTVLRIQKSATYHGVPASELDFEHKKKLENLILFSFLPHLKRIPTIIYE